MIPRYLLAAVLDKLDTYPVVAITGPRQAGKTTLAKAISHQVQRPVLYLDLELPSDANKLRNPEFFLRENEAKLIVIDEVQRQPELFPLLRALVDQRREPARFLILGSASPELLRQRSETLAGRIAYLELTPLHRREVATYPQNQHWLRGGFPLALLAPSDEAAFDWLTQFTTTFVERDLPQFGLTAPAQTLRNLLLMLSSMHGSQLNYSTLAKSMGLTVPTIKRYLAYFEAAYFIRTLPPWFANVKKRLVKTPKVYLRDSGVLHGLADLTSLNTLMGHALVGASWEGYVIQQVLANLPPRVQPFFYRTQGGAELDLILVRGHTPYLTIEVKFSDRPSLSKGNRHAMTDLNAPLNLIVTPAGGDYPLEPNLRVCELDAVWPYLS
jgi:uncharacterized protein